MTGFTIGVVSHVDRLPMAEDLFSRVSADYMSVDGGTLGCFRNHHHTWGHLAEQHGDWCVVLEDDAQPVDGFRTQLEQALTTAPTPIVSLYLGRTRPRRWQDRIAKASTQADSINACWITAPALLHSVGVAIRTHLIADMLNSLSTRAPIDTAISTWAHTRHRVAYTWPSLVDHHDGPTLVRHPYRPLKGEGPRVAWRTGTRHQWDDTQVAMQ